MTCPHCRSSATSQRRHRTELGYRRFRCRSCGRRFNERTGSGFNELHYRRRSRGRRRPRVRNALREYFPGALEAVAPTRWLLDGNAPAATLERIVAPSTGASSDEPGSDNAQRAETEQRRGAAQVSNHLIIGDATRSLAGVVVGRQNLMRPTDTHDANLLAAACCRLAGSASAAPACVPPESRAPMTDAAASRCSAGRTHQAPASDAVR